MKSRTRVNSASISYAPNPFGTYGDLMATEEDEARQAETEPLIDPIHPLDRLYCHELLKKLPAWDQRLLRKRFWEKKTLDEIAKEMKLTREGVRLRIAVLLEKIKNHESRERWVQTLSESRRERARGFRLFWQTLMRRR